MTVQSHKPFNNPFEFQDKLIDLLGIPQEMAETICKIVIHSDTKSAPTAEITCEIFKNQEFRTETQKFEIVPIPPEKP